MRRRSSARLSTYLEEEFRQVEAFKDEADRFLSMAETSMRKNLVGVGRSASADAALPSANTARTEGDGSPKKSFKQRTSLMVDMMDRIRGKRSISKEGGNLLGLECDTLILKQQEIEKDINTVMAMSLNNETVLLEQASQQWKHVCCCIDIMQEKSTKQKVKIDEVSFYVSNMDQFILDIESIRLFLNGVRELKDDGDFSIYRNISIDSDDEKKKAEEEKKCEERVSMDIVLSRMDNMKAARSSANKFLTKLLEEREAMELSLSHLRECRDTIRKAIEDVVGYMTVEEFIEEKVAHVHAKPFDHRYCNDCDTFASMSVESTGMLEESHDKAAASTELLQQVLMLGASLSSMKMRLAEFTGPPSPAKS